MKYINLFDTQAAYDAAEKYYPNVSYIEATDEVVYQETDPGPDYSKEYLTFEALQSGTFTLTVPAAVDSTYMTSISYSIDNGANWVDTTIDNTAQTITTPTIAQGDKVLWKGIGNTMASSAVRSNFSSSGNFNVSGNIMSLLFNNSYKTANFDANNMYAYNCLFMNTTTVVSAENLVLPATTLANTCYSNMFSGCTALTTAPVLPATTLANHCYANMFRGCTSLTTAPELPATNLEIGCYSGMFFGCTALTTAPELPATNLRQNCYNYMFQLCTALTTAPELPATTLANYCYQEMFKGCTSLTTAPVLPATTLANYCYNGMFSGCTNLNNITMLATNISANAPLFDWVSNVASTGTFTKAASMTTLPSGDSGIPSGWTVQNA